MAQGSSNLQRLQSALERRLMTVQDLQNQALNLPIGDR
jgi:hypothetical protein